MLAPDFQKLDPPGRPNETIAWCPLCGEVINRWMPDENWWDARFENAAAEHMLSVHELEPDVAIAKLMQAVRNP